MTARSLASSREKARARILAGEVVVDGVPAAKPGLMIDENAEITLLGEGERFVGRGGEKLEKLLAEKKPVLTGLRCLDVGASTGGFTDAMLKRGAEIVYAVDVGTGQLAEELRSDRRVVNLEKTDIRTVTPEMLGGAVDFAGIDVSFISLSKILPQVALLVRPGGELGCLIKPQFEAGRERVGKHGVVRDPDVHVSVLCAVLAAAAAAGFAARELTYSPIRGGSGNIEYLLYAVRTEEGVLAEMPDAGLAERTVHEAFLYHRQ